MTVSLIKPVDLAKRVRPAPVIVARIVLGARPVQVSK